MRLTREVSEGFDSDFYDGSARGSVFGVSGLRGFRVVDLRWALGRGFVSRVQALRVQSLSVSSRIEHEGLYPKALRTHILRL